MIIRETPINNAWHRAAGIWFIALFCLNSVAWPILDHYGPDLANLRWLLWLMPTGTLMLALLGRVIGPPQRVLHYVFIIGLFGIVPLLVGLYLPIVTLLLFSRLPAATHILTGIFVVLLFYWISTEVMSLRSRVTKTKFIDREFKIDTKFIFVNRSPKTDIESPDKTEASLLKRLAASIMPALLYALPPALALHRYFYGRDDTPAVILILALLATPLAIHVSCQLARGSYLWIYVVWKLERQQGKHVMLRR